MDFIVRNYILSDVRGKLIMGNVCERKILTVTFYRSKTYFNSLLWLTLKKCKKKLLKRNIYKGKFTTIISPINYKFISIHYMVLYSY